MIDVRFLYLGYRSLYRLASPSRSTDSHGRTDGLTEREVQLRGDLSGRNARVAQPPALTNRALQLVRLLIRRAHTRPPAYVGRHREPTHARGGHGITWWIYAAIACGYAWLTWRMAVIELPLMVAAGAAMTFALAYTAGRNHP